MSITVVTVRDEFGAPTAREVYASGHRYTIGNGYLEILSAEPRLLALYPSGNWLSAYVDDCLTVISPVQMDSSGAGGFGSGDDSVDAGFADSDSDADSDPDADSADLAPPADAGADGDAALADSDADLAEPDADPSTLSEPNAPGEEAVSREPAESPEPATLPPGMMRVAFRPVTVKRPRGVQADAPDTSRLRPVAFAPRILRAVRNEDDGEAEPRSTRLRPVAFAPRTYRAARTQPGPHTPDDTPPADDEPGGSPR